MKATTNNTQTSQQSDTTPKRVYRVVASSFFRYAIYVEAASEDAALDIGISVDTDHWDLEHDDWEVEYAEVVVDACPEDMLPPGAYNSR